MALAPSQVPPLPPVPPPSEAVDEARWQRDFPRRGLITAAVCAVVALALSLGSGRPRVVGVSVVYTVLVGLTCWLIIDGGRLLLAAAWVRMPWAPRWRLPAWPLLALLWVPLGTLIGLTVGHRLGSAVTGFAWQPGAARAAAGWPRW